MYVWKVVKEDCVDKFYVNFINVLNGLFLNLIWRKRWNFILVWIDCGGVVSFMVVRLIRVGKWNVYN